MQTIKFFKKFEWIFVVMILVAAFLLISHAARIPFNGSDELEHLELSKKISLNPFVINLSGKNFIPDHPMLTTYCVRIGTWLMKSYQPFSVRFVFILTGVVGILFVFLLARSGLGIQGAFLSTILLCSSQFYVRYMGYATEDSLLMVFGILALWIFFQALQKDDTRWMIFLGFILGFGFLAKESMLIFVGIFTYYLAVHPKYRNWLRRKEYYFSLLIMCVIIGPTVLWNISNSFISMKFGTSEAGFGLSPVVPMLYFGEIISQFVDKSVILEAIDCEYPFVHWVMGVLVIIAVIYACLKKEKTDLMKLLLTVFFFNTIPFLFIKNRFPERFLNNHDWPSLAIIPGIILVAAFLIDMKNRWRLGKYVIGLLICYFMMHIWNFVNIPEPFFIQRADLQSKKIFREAERLVSVGKIDQAIDQYQTIIKMAPASMSSVGSLEKLGFIYFYKGQSQAARDSWIMGLQIDPSHRAINQHLSFSQMAYADEELRVYFKFNSIDEPTILYREGLNIPFEMWFEASRTPGISYAHSVDGIKWIRKNSENDIVISGTGKAGDWNQFIETPEVIFHKGKYLMIFVGYNYDVNKDGDQNTTDEAADGIGFTSSPSTQSGWEQPIKIISRSRVKEAWDYGHVGDPSRLVFDPIERRFHLWYT